MDSSRRRSSSRGGVVVGSIWESRMKIDEVKGGVKVFNGEENSSEENGENGKTATATADAGVQVYERPKSKQSPVGGSGKRKTWKSESPDGSARSPIQIARQKPEASKNLDAQFKELSSSAEGIKGSPIQRKKTRSLSMKGSGVGGGGSGDGIERKSAPLRKVKSEANKDSSENSDENEKNSQPPLPKPKSMPIKALEEDSGKIENGLGDKIKGNPIESRKTKSESIDEKIQKNPVEIGSFRSDETCKEVSVCEEKVITNSNFNGVGKVKSPPNLEESDDIDSDEEEEDWGEEIEIEIEQKLKKVVIEEKKLHQITEKSPPISPIVKKHPPSAMKTHQNTEKSLPISPIVKKNTPPVSNLLRNHSTPTKSTPTTNEVRRIPRTHNKLQSLVDLVMWREVPKSAFVFGFGTFIIISFSYTQDLNFSFISVVSYLGLVYLAAIFLFRSFIYRGDVDIDDTSHDYVVGEEEAAWLLKLVLPYLNEFLVKIKALFTGDPATTMKLAVLLFVLARCGSSITLWKMSKLGFFGVFIVPKICSSYSTQLTAYGKFWVQRFRDAWESCSHKKAVAFVVFTLVWNLSSVVARIWAVFMLFVAFRYYQQSVMRGEWVEEEERGDTWQPTIGGRHGPTQFEIKSKRKEHK